MNRLSPAEQEMVVNLLLVPGATCRSVAKLTGYAKSTVFLLACNLKLPPCPCGEEAGHRGWCKYRYSKSSKRQKVMAQMHNTENCGVCLQDGLKVASTHYVAGVFLCQACSMILADEPEILAKAKAFVESLPEEKPQPRFVEPGIEKPDIINPVRSIPIPKTQVQVIDPPKVTEEKTVEPPWTGQVELCGCGKPLKHAGRCKGMKVIREPNTNTRVTVPAEMVPVAGTKSMTIKRTRTQTDEVQIQHNHEVTMNRRVTILVPKIQPITQVLITPEIAQAVWNSLTMEQKFRLFDVEGMWADYDDWLRMCIINKVLLVDGDEVEKAGKAKEGK